MTQTDYPKRNQMSAQTFLKGKTTTIGLSKGGKPVMIANGVAIALSKIAYNLLRQGITENLQYFEFKVDNNWIPCICKGKQSYNLSINDLLRSLVKPEYVLLFDLDGTLLDTDMANNCAYEYALRKITGRSDYSALRGLQRITRKDVAAINSINAETLESIINVKQYYYGFLLSYGGITPFITEDILKRHYQRNNCYLVTSANNERTQKLIEHYQLRQYFKNIIYTDSNDKYNNITAKIGVNASQIILFENEKNATISAIGNGILRNHIVIVDNNVLKKHIIRHNAFLKYDTLAFYHTYYIGYKKPLNPDFINDLKNQFCTIPTNQLQIAFDKLVRYLINGIEWIYNILKKEELTIITIPRAKSESTYQPQQQLFKQGVSETIKKLCTNKSIKLIDGSHFITRHTNTKTTHLSKCQTIVNDGKMPYVGITYDTCSISNEVVGKDILLIDDIYTKDVNIDEDAIQALYDRGAKSVTFYSICRTYKV